MLVVCRFVGENALNTVLWTTRRSKERVPDDRLGDVSDWLRLRYTESIPSKNINKFSNVNFSVNLQLYAAKSQY